MYGIFTYIWDICRVNVGKYTIHGWSGKWCPPSYRLIWPHALGRFLSRRESNYFGCLQSKSTSTVKLSLMVWVGWSFWYPKVVASTWIASHGKSLSSLQLTGLAMRLQEICWWPGKPPFSYAFLHDVPIFPWVLPSFYVWPSSNWWFSVGDLSLWALVPALKRAVFEWGSTSNPAKTQQ